MNKGTKLAAAAIAATVGACTAPGIPSHPDCGISPVITVNHERGYLSVRPEHLRGVCAGQTVIVRIVPPRGGHTAPKEGQPFWLGGESNRRGLIELRVPDGTKYDTYEYTITVDDVGMLDPRLTVSRR